MCRGDEILNYLVAWNLLSERVRLTTAIAGIISTAASHVYMVRILIVYNKQVLVLSLLLVLYAWYQFGIFG